MEPILPELDYLSSEPVQHAVAQRSYITVQPVGDTYKTDGDLRFEIPPSENSTALHESYLRIRCKIVKKNGDACNHSATTGADTVGVVNNVLHSMWKQVTVSLNGHKVEKIDNYPYRAYISTLTSYSSDVLKSRGELQGWAKDTAGEFSDLSLASAGKNKGLVQRTVPFKSSAEVELIGRIQSDVMNQGRNIPPNTRIEICLSRASNCFVLLCSTTQEEYKLLITSAELEVARDKLAPSLLQAHRELANKFNMSLDYRHSKVITFNLNSGTTSGNIADCFSSKHRLPDRFVAFFVNNNAFSGSYSTNPFDFAHHNIKYLAAKLNDTSTKIPPSGYKPNFASGTYSHEYYMLLREFNADEEDFMLDISKQDFAGGYAIYPFRIVHRTRGGAVLGPPQTGSVSIEYEFTSALTSTLTLVLVADYRGSFEIRDSGDFAALKL